MSAERTLQQVWNATYSPIEAICQKSNDIDIVRARIRNLREVYGNATTGEKPDFASRETQLAYAVAYHPAHVYTYFHLLQHSQIGDKVFAQREHAPQLLVLGAGLGAETAAVMHWHEYNTKTYETPIQIQHVDLFDWEQCRQDILDPVVADAISSGRLQVTSKTLDLLSERGLKFLKNAKGKFNVVFVPSSLSELYKQTAYPRLLKHLKDLVSNGAVIVMIDHDLPEFKKSVQPLTEGMRCESGRSAKGQIRVPQVPDWIGKNLLQSKNKLRPLTSYASTWMLIARDGTSGNAGPAHHTPRPESPKPKSPVGKAPKKRSAKKKLSQTAQASESSTRRSQQQSRAGSSKYAASRTPDQRPVKKQRPTLKVKSAGMIGQQRQRPMLPVKRVSRDQGDDE